MYYINDPDFPALSANSSSSAGHPRLAKAQGFTEHTDTEDLKAIDALVTTLRSHSRHCLRDFLNPKIRTFYFCSKYTMRLKTLPFLLREHVINRQ